MGDRDFCGDLRDRQCFFSDEMDPRQQTRQTPHGGVKTCGGAAGENARPTFIAMAKVR
jgi:hypothetical protein